MVELVAVVDGDGVADVGTVVRDGGGLGLRVCFRDALTLALSHGERGR